ncbi:peptide chain release factor N(5)-glutamine methyltransferase [Faecalispora anaeroviscerum]|uniref:peptide chain release factor N(5)-glutamine methyltransferase n=1 Tax=Faecalispora anaeroviscerum TaxID=2991836 RepID=UPI0024B95F07|nr:peptide chain release factor N(5)-glutamine methyltransferase [Faecalispora anaeroviscerum]
MTFEQAYQQGKSLLQRAGVESPAFDTICLFRRAFGMDRQGLLLRGEEQAPPMQAKEFFRTIEERSSRRPLQYILGEWEFFGMRLAVGEGVLIPREETELLVYTAAELLGGHPAPLVADLCAGTGAVGLGLSRLRGDARVTCVEWYEQAFSYLNENLSRYGEDRISAVQADITQEDAAPELTNLSAVISNPPYIDSAELPQLQKEVQAEPATALDGGGDGLDFYRAIANIWLPRLRPGGIAAVEIGEKQAEQVSALFRQAGLLRIRVHQDFNGFDRVVSGVYQRI